MRSLWWGAMPNEQDGGAVINYYLLKMMNYLESNHQFYGIPKVPSMLEASALPFMQFHIIDYKRDEFPDKHVFEEIPAFVSKNSIPLLVMFHIPWEYFPIVNLMKGIKTKTLVHQTVHWDTDVMFQSKVLNAIDMWVAPTQWGMEQLSITGKIPRKNITYLPHAVDIEKFYSHNTSFRESLNLAPNQKVILLTGRCSLAKGFHKVISVMRPIIKDYDSVFIIRGSMHPNVAKSEEIGYLYHIMAQQFPKNIIFLPDWLPPEMIEEIMASCDILCQPSGHEGFDVPLIEAMACKKAIAVTNIPNHYEIMGKRNRYCGVFMEPSEVAEVINNDQQEIKVPSSEVIEETLRFLLENPEECKAMGENGYARVKRHYNLAKVATNWLELMSDISEGDS